MTVLASRAPRRGFSAATVVLIALGGALAPVRTAHGAAPPGGVGADPGANGTAVYAAYDVTGKPVGRVRSIWTCDESQISEEAGVKNPITFQFQWVFGGLKVVIDLKPIYESQLGELSIPGQGFWAHETCKLKEGTWDCPPGVPPPPDPTSVGCTQNFNVQPTRIVWLSTVPVDPIEPLHKQAVDLLTLPLPDLQRSPNAPTTAVIGRRTWFWANEANWTARSVTVHAGPFSVTATAVPLSMDVTAGAGQSVHCRDGGRHWEASFVDPAAIPADACSLTFGKAGTVGLTATSHWRGEWGSSLGTGGTWNEDKAETANLGVSEAAAVTVNG